jgi:hypothetical protein
MLGWPGRRITGETAAACDVIGAIEQRTAPVPARQHPGQQ